MLHHHKIISPLTRGSEQFGGAMETLMSLKIASLLCGAKFSSLKQREIFVQMLLYRAWYNLTNIHVLILNLLVGNEISNASTKFNHKPLLASMVLWPDCRKASAYLAVSTRCSSNNLMA